MEHEQDWNREASFIARALDHGDAQTAESRLYADLYHLQNRPQEHNEFLARVNYMDHKGYGLDLQLRQGPYGEDSWSITEGQYTPPGYSYEPAPYNNYRPQPYGYVPPAYAPRPYAVQPESLLPGNAGQALVEGLAAAAGTALILGAIGRPRPYYEHRHHRW